MADPDKVNQRMRSDWDERARLDARFFVAFGRRGQTREEFLATAGEVLHALRAEFPRLGSAAERKRLTALEIGCGPGRLMLPLSKDFGRVLGFDVSGEMVRLARENLAGAANAEARRNSGADLSGVENESVDFCYSYAVFQHIPDREIIWNYLREARRVLKTGGLLRFQCNGLPGRRQDSNPVPVRGWSSRAASAAPVADPATAVPAHEPDTWQGVSFRPEEIAAFAEREDLQLLAMDRFDTQYMWITARKPKPGWRSPSAAARRARIVRVTDTFTADAVVAASERYASASVWAIDLPADSDLNRLRVRIDGDQVAPCFIGKHRAGNPTQVNVYLPPGVRTGIVPVQLMLDGRLLSQEAPMRVMAPGPLVPRFLGLSDPVNLLSRTSIQTRVLKLQIEEVHLEGPDEVLDAFQARIGNRPVESVEARCLDPVSRLYGFDLSIPAGMPPGKYLLEIRLGSRRFEPAEIQIADVSPVGANPTARTQSRRRVRSLQ